MRKIVLLVSLCVVLFSSCKEIDTSILNEYNGAFILNEGISKSSLSHYNYEDQTCTSDYIVLEGKANSMRIIGEGSSAKAFFNLPVVGSAISYSLDSKSEEKSFDLVESHEMLCSNPVTDNALYAATIDTLYEYNIETLDVKDKLSISDGVSQMVTSGKFLYVANQKTDSVYVYDMSSNKAQDTLSVLAQPIDMKVDADGHVWVYCQGHADGSEFGLVKIERDFITTKLVHRVYAYRGERVKNMDNCLTLSKDKRSLFFVNGNVIKMSVYHEDELSDRTLSTNKFLSDNYDKVSFSGLNVDPRTGNLYCLISNGESAGQLLIVENTDEEKGSLKEQYSVGVKPLAVGFNY